jgi:hypothetical protein
MARHQLPPHVITCLWSLSNRAHSRLLVIQALYTETGQKTCYTALLAAWSTDTKITQITYQLVLADSGAKQMLAPLGVILEPSLHAPLPHRHRHHAGNVVNYPDSWAR